MRQLPVYAEVGGGGEAGEVMLLRWLRATVESFGSPRSGSWPRVRRDHLAREPACIACGRGKSLEVHHVVPVSQDSSRELDPGNLVTLCGEPCHFVFGHLLSWTISNPHVREDAARYLERRQGAKPA
jgi:hypothetical protein